MHLLIRAVSLAGQPLTQAISAYFDERGGTMGRSDTNTLALPDPERRISRLQAEVARVPEGWRLQNVGNANPIWHNNKPVGPGEAVLLDENDELQVGSYSLQVSYSSDPTARTITKGRAAVDARTVIVGSGVEPRTDPSRMGGISVSMVTSASLPSHTAATAAPSAPATSAAHPSAAHLPASHDGETQLVPDAGRVNVTQAPPVAMSALAPAPVPAPAPAPAPAAALPVAPPAPATSPFGDLLGSGAGTAAPSAAPAGRSPFDDLFAAPAGVSQPQLQPPSQPTSASASAADPFADLLGLGTPATAPARPSAPAAAPAAAAARLPDDFDPFADLGAPGGGARAAAASPFDGLGLGSGTGQAGLQGVDLMGGQGGGAQGGTASTIDQLFGLSGAATPGADPLAGFLARTAPAVPQEAAVGAPSSVDPLALIQSPQTPAEPAADALPAQATPLPDDVPEVQGLMALPAVMDEPAVFTGVGGGAAVPAPAAEVPAAAPTSFDDLLSGLAPPTQPGGLSVQPSELPALSAQHHGERTALRTTPSLVQAPTRGEHSERVDVNATVGPVLSSSPALSLAEPVAFDSLMPHAVRPPEEQVTTPGELSPPELRSAGMPMAGTSADTLALWSAFCQGAGVDFTPPQGLNPDLMRIIGQLLRRSIDGSLRLVAARAATKQELRAEVTVIQAKGNNPLKFSPDAQSALEQLLQPPLRGFMPGPDAVSDAMDDLLGHVIGTMVGTRAALEGVLQRFEPAQLEAKLAGRSVMDSLLPMNRRAKLWELYLQHYDGVRSEAQEDFHNLFGKAFLQAYEEQLDRLDAERRAAKPSARSA